MKTGRRIDRFWASVLVWLALGNVPLLAQSVIVPDETLGSERSRVLSLDESGFPVDVIDRGAERGSNLFHSFLEFNVSEGRTAYFLTPNAEIQNIFARVTGGNRSDILGTLGTLQDGTFTATNANLFLINPNGLLFGANARLDMGGSFVGTTANAIGFGNSVFSATSPEIPSTLLTINPSAFLFGQAPSGAIASSARLAAPIGESLLLIGGDVTLDGGQIIAPAGYIDLAGIAGVGSVPLAPDEQLKIDLLSGVAQANVSLLNGSLLDVSADRAGEIQIQGDRVLLSGRSSVFSSTVSQNGGEILVQANQVELLNDSRLITFTSGAGNSGSITIGGINISLQNDSTIGTFADTSSGQAGNGGDVTISTRAIDVRDGSSVTSITSGQGQGGDLTITASESTQLSGSAIVLGFATTLSTGTNGAGKAGNLRLDTGRLIVQDGAEIAATSFGAGNAGNLNVTADSIELFGVSSDRLHRSNISSQSGFDSSTGGIAGDVTVSTRTLNLRDGSFISTTTFGSGQGGDITITARESTELSGSAIIDGEAERTSLVTGTQGSGGAGNLRLDTGRLIIQDGAEINSSTRSVGDAGNLNITADSIELSGVSSDRFFRSGINSLADPSTGIVDTGDAGDITISTRTLDVRDGSFISTATFGSGQGGDLTITASESTQLSGSVSVDGESRSAFLFTDTLGAGRAGNFRLNTGRLIVQGVAEISTSTFDSGDAGDLNITADSIELIGVSSDRPLSAGISSQSFNISNISNEVGGDAGNVSISSRSLSVRDGAFISTATLGTGQGGNLRIRVQDSTELTGWAALNGRDNRSGLFTLTNGTDDAGRLDLRTGRLNLQRGAIISSVTSGEGNAGNIRVAADGAIILRGNGGTQNQFVSSISSSILPGGRGDAGNTNIRAGSLTLRDGANISATVGQQGNNGQGNTIPGGQGRGGNIRLNVDNFIDISGISRNGFSSGILALTERGARGRAGNINIDTRNLRVANGGIIAASTFNSSQAGNIIINADNFTALSGGQVVTNTRNEGNAGRIELNIDGNTTIGGIDLGFSNRRQRIQRFRNSAPIGSVQFSDIFINQGQTSGIFVNTTQNSRGRGGRVELSTDDLTLENQGAIAAQSLGSGRAGSIVVNAENTTLDRAQISARSRQNQPAGNITLNIDNTINATNSGITTSAQQSSGGRITVNAGEISLDNSTISTRVGTGGGNGGNISVNTDGAVILDNNSDIQTRVLQGRGNGGGIRVNAEAILAFSDSDVITSATEGRGGDITFNTSAFFGDNYQPDAPISSDRVNVDASGNVDDGTISTPDTSFIQNSLTDLPDSSINIDRLLANTCIVRDRQQGQFTVTGSGGLPNRPGNSTAAYPTGAIAPIPTAPSAESSRRWQMGDAIQEPQGVYKLSDGRLVISRECAQEPQ